MPNLMYEFSVDNLPVSYPFRVKRKPHYGVK